MQSVVYGKCRLNFSIKGEVGGPYNTHGMNKCIHNTDWKCQREISVERERVKRKNWDNIKIYCE
jgi:hypothetical protein